MILVSASLIVRNEEDKICRVIESVKPLCNEVVVVDTGSLDNTVTFAEECGARVEFFEWVDDFAAARNYAASKCRGKWIFTIDADEVLQGDPDKIRKEIISLGKDISYIYVPVAREQHTVVFDSRRMVRNGYGTWKNACHEIMRVKEGDGYTLKNGRILHDYVIGHRESSFDRNIRILKGMLKDNPSGPRTLFYIGQELKSSGDCAGAIVYFERYVGISTWGAEKCRAYLHIADCYMKMERFDEALSAAFESLKINEYVIEAYILISYIHAAMGNLIMGKKWAEFALDLPPNAVPIVMEDADMNKLYDVLSVMCYQLGEYKEGIQYARMLVDAHPTVETFVTNLKEYEDKLNIG